MGTSVSQPSKRTSNWKPVFACYQNEKIPESRLINEIWRASENEDRPISTQIKSDAIFACYQAVNSSENFQEALSKFNSSIIRYKNNSVVAEFAKRVIPLAFQSKNPATNWSNNFFSEITNYIVSRDASGFVGASNRNKSVEQLIEFKKNIGDKVTKIVASESKIFKSKSDWNSFVDKTIKKLKSSK